MRKGILLARTEEAGFRVHGTGFAGWKRKRDARVLLSAVNDMRRMMKKGRFDIVHTYLYWSDVLGVAAARLAGCPRIIVSRRSLHSGAHPPKRLSHALEQITNLFANELIANSETVLKDAEAQEPFLPSIRTVIYNGIDVQSYQPVQSRVAGPLRLRSQWER